mgnify:FL=1|jgi:hypothetical protein
MENKKQYPKDIGCIWIKNSSYGDYLSIQVEINGVKHNFTAFKNRFYEPDSKKPYYTIPAPKQPQEPQKQADSYQSKLDFIAAEKAKMAQQKTPANVGAMMKDAGLMEQEDIPF